DVNNDGYSDVIVGAYLKDMAFIYYGSSSGIGTSANVTIIGVSTSGFGNSVATTGDVNNDGYDDIVIGAYTFGSGKGAAFIYYGSATGINNASANASVYGQNYLDYRGFSVASAGDFNNDSYGDIIVGEYGYSSGGNTGRAYVYYGSATGIDNASANMTITGVANSYFGISVASAGDANNDDYEDVIVGAVGFSSWLGGAYIYSIVNSTIVTPVTSAGLRINHSQVWDALSFSGLASLSNLTAYLQTNLTGVGEILVPGDPEKEIPDTYYNSSCAMDASNNCTVALNIIGETGTVQLGSLNITYGTQPAGMNSSYIYNSTEHANLSASVQTNDTTLYIWNVSSLRAIMMVNTTFASQPNYTGWVGQEGVNSTDSRAYVITSALLADAQNTSQKILLIRAGNTSYTSVCKIDAATTAAVLMAITNQTQCTTAGGTAATADTVDIAGATYFMITGMANSGAVQINNTNGNSPIITGVSASPTSGNVETNFAFSATVVDPDNDALSYVRVYLNGNQYTLGETDPADTTTSDGKSYSAVTQLQTGSYSYYFKASDGTNTATTTTYTGLLVTGRPTQIVVNTSEFDIAGLAVLFVLAVIVLIMFRNKKFRTEGASEPATRKAKKRKSAAKLKKKKKK
ncbi:MAG: VCBS repeat-containing protein, partial [Candidatus Micrarchaeota archaeon]